MTIDTITLTFEIIFVTNLMYVVKKYGFLIYNIMIEEYNEL